MNVAKVVFGLLSTASLGALAAYSWLVFQGTSELLYSTASDGRMNWQRKFFFALAAAGFLACVFNGIYGLLFWMPDNWGHIDENGDFETTRFALATVGTTFIGIMLMQALNSVTHLKFSQRTQHIECKGLEDILQAAHSVGWLEGIKERHLKRIAELEKEGPLGFDSHLTMRGQEIQVLHRLIWHIEQKLKILEPA